jgi:AraC-like DNA-binding protein
MLMTSAKRPPEASVAPTRAWRPFPCEVADFLCVEEPVAEMRPRMYARNSVTLVPSPAVVRVESGRSMIVEACSLLLVPAWQLFALRSPGGAERVAVTVLFGAGEAKPHAGGCSSSDRAAIVADAELGAEASAAVAQLRQPVHLIEGARAGCALLERLTLGSTPVTAARSSQLATPLAPVRDYLRAHLGEQVTTVALARMSGLTEWHLIRAFHREFGLPPHAYHLRMRLAAASDLLAAGVSVSTTAYECGFADQSHLSRKFKEVYGLTPAAWAGAVGGKRNGEQQVRSIGTPAAGGMLRRSDPPMQWLARPTETSTRAARAAGRTQ